MKIINLLYVIPGRAEPSDKAEMITQLLFGESLELLEEQEKWCKVKNLEDDYECWVDKKQLTFVEDEEFEVWNSVNKSYNCVPQFTLLSNRGSIHLSYGAWVPDSQAINIGDWRISIKSTIQCKADNWSSYVITWINTPYLWGGKTLMGVDCSGFVQQCFAYLGVYLPRDAWQQQQKGELIGNASSWKKGDLAFFESNGKVTHVGIIWEDQKIIHASGRVRIDLLSEEGIRDLNDINNLTHKLHSVKRVYEFEH
ncbi:C40 family peptidase [Luteibaculum oceani]|uniref:NlpC/P60 family protein n=1 Tax=Luteibaculum oceani TaxID=1294296 RepID=A0A5C6UTD0_9FLAO|nr:NlpC/P60 family protein [Luteibaculum oceani]TXC76229.1 NlpC/P60 family protein [Luteibaculum oceani]